MLKSYWVVVVGGGGLCDFCVSPSPFGLDFGTLDFGTSDSGLTIMVLPFIYCLYLSANNLEHLCSEVTRIEKHSNSYSI